MDPTDFPHPPDPLYLEFTDYASGSRPDRDPEGYSLAGSYTEFTDSAAGFEPRPGESLPGKPRPRFGDKPANADLLIAALRRRIEALRNNIAKLEAFLDERERGQDSGF